MTHPKLAALLLLASLATPGVARACACHFLACGGGGRSSRLAEPEGVHAHRYWELTLRLTEGRVTVEAVELKEERSPLRFRRGRGYNRVETVAHGATLEEHHFSFGEEGNLRLVSALTVVRVPYHPDATTLQVRAHDTVATVELNDNEDSAESILVRRLLGALQPPRL